MPTYVLEKEKTARYRQVVAAIKELTQAEGLDMAQRACAEAVTRSVRKNFTALYGAKQSAIYVKHLKKLIGPPYYPVDFNPLVNRLRFPPGSDHTSLWNQDGEPALLVSQPYSLRYKTLKDMVDFCETHGMEVEVDAYLSWHFPGRTLALIYKKVKPPKAID